MKTNKFNQRDADLLNEYYNGNYEEKAGLKIKSLFSRWLFGKYNNIEIEKTLDEVWAKEKVDPQTWEKSRAKIDNILSRVELPEINTQNKKVKFKLARTLIRVAAVIIPLLILTGGFWWYSTKHDSPSQAIEYAVNNGTIEKVVLADKTQVWINAGSKITYEQTKGHERVLELNGEGYFIVAKDEKRPFIVKTADMQIRVLGTQFNVVTYSDRNSSTITLTEGAVTVTLDDGRKWMIKPNQQFVYDRQINDGKVVALSEYETKINAEWMDGKLICDLITIPEILKSVERKYNLQIDVDTSVKFSDEKYIMEFRAGDTPEFILDWLTQLENSFTYKVDGGQVTIAAAI